MILLCNCAIELDKARLDHESNPDMISFAMVIIRDLGNGQFEHRVISHKLTDGGYGEAISDLINVRIQARSRGFLY